MSVPEPLKEIVVIGAGVVGLTTALRIQEREGYHVTILAEIFPSDPKSPKYTSQWAGAQHVSGTNQEPQKQYEKETFDFMWDLSAPGGKAEGSFFRLTNIDYYDEADKVLKPHPQEYMPDFKYLPKEDLLEGAELGVSFTTLTIDVPVYLNYLLARFLAAGGATVKGAVQHISQVVDGGAGVFSGAKTTSRPAAVFVCAGLGARFLGGVEDKDVYPIRGQTVLVRAPWVKKMVVRLKKDAITYIIPRRSGDVIVGGTFLIDDWYPKARPETAKTILENALETYPELAPPEIRAERKPTLEDLYSIKIEDGCGLRPARKGGIRVDVEVQNGVPIVFNYGHGSVGFQSSWGSAGRAVEVLEGALAKI